MTFPEARRSIFCRREKPVLCLVFARKLDFRGLLLAILAFFLFSFILEASLPLVPRVIVHSVSNENQIKSNKHFTDANYNILYLSQHLNNALKLLL